MLSGVFVLEKSPLDLCLSVHTTEPEAQLLSCCTQLTAQKYITQVKQKQIPISN